MAKKYDEHPLGKLSDEELDQILELYGSSYSAENKENVIRKTQMKKKEPVILAAFSKRKLLLIAVLLLIFFPVGSYLAVKFRALTVEKQDYQLTTKIDKATSQQPDTGHYRLVADYVPKYFTSYDSLQELSFYEDLPTETEEDLEAFIKARGITFTLYELNQKDTVIDDYVKEFKEIPLKDSSAYMIEKLDDFGEAQETVFRKFFEKQNKFVEMTCFGDIPEKDTKKILEHLFLKNVTTEEEASLAIEYMTPDDKQERIAGISEGIEPLMLDINNKSELVQLNEPINTIDIYDAPVEEITVLKATLSDTIAPKTLSILNKRLKMGIYARVFGEKWDKKGKLLPIIATEYTLGDGRTTLSKKIRNVEIKPKYLEVELAVKNITDETINYSPSIQVECLVKQGNYFTNLPTETELIHHVPSDPFENYRKLNTPAHSLPTGVGKIVGDTFEEEESSQSIAPGETATFTTSYLVAYEDYSSLFFNLNAVSPGNRYVQLTQ
ncbi:hypothetical protein [Candidatus Enterococcus murrayae]|uniref:Uncharacterized protein n=1 Tax=Candidatus Enterococcus murrayae TaxID=2815321 RepID=A0ABS3HJU0_9ENTE|nr:hypothetical protein [Enterococcus sp. MJM16]MBO0453732.1 hypothetical protein [Enterococcus sp. MJM16]